MGREALLVGLLGAWLALDRRAFLQAMISRPLVAGTAAGSVLGDPTTGLFIGLVFELLYLGDASLGGSAPDNDTVPTLGAAVFAATVARANGIPGNPSLWALGILLWAPTGAFGRLIEWALDERARKYSGRALEATEGGDMRRAARQNMRAMWPHALFTSAVGVGALLLGYLVAPLVMAVPPAVVRGLAWVYPALGAVAAGAAVQRTGARRRLVAGALGAATVALYYLLGVQQ